MTKIKNKKIYHRSRSGVNSDSVSTYIKFNALEFSTGSESGIRSAALASSHYYDKSVSGTRFKSWATK